MAQHRKALWEADLDEDLQDVDLNLAIGSYGQNDLYNDGTKHSPYSSVSGTQANVPHNSPKSY